MAQQPPLKSPDGQWFWDGSQWRTLVSGDGRSIWSGSAWVPLPPGTTVSVPPPPPPAAMVAPAPSPGTPAVAGPPPPPIDWAAQRQAAFGPPVYSGIRYAGFWIRFLAAFIDGLIISVPLFVLFFALYGSSVNAALANQGGSAPPTITTTPLNGLSLVLGFFYFSYFWSVGATPGMRLFGIHVVDANSQGQISFGRAALRYLGYLVSTFCCYVGLIWAAFDARKQGWHDKIATTLVVYR